MLLPVTVDFGEFGLRMLLLNNIGMSCLNGITMYGSSIYLLRISSFPFAGDSTAQPLMPFLAGKFSVLDVDIHSDSR